MENSITRPNCTLSYGSSDSKLVQFGQKVYHGRGHELILESHDESTRNAFIYIGLILIVYVMAVIAIAVRYLLMRSNREFLPFSPPHQVSKARRSTGFTTQTTMTGPVFVSPQVTIEHVPCSIEVGLKETEL